jgi:hypothetical protein
MPKSFPLRNTELYKESTVGGTSDYDGKNTGESSKQKDSGPTKPTTDVYGEALGRKDWKGRQGRKNWKG